MNKRDIDLLITDLELIKKLMPEADAISLQAELIAIANEPVVFEWL